MKFWLLIIFFITVWFGLFSQVGSIVTQTDRQADNLHDDSCVLTDPDPEPGCVDLSPDINVMLSC